MIQEPLQAVKIRARAISTSEFGYLRRIGGSVTKEKEFLSRRERYAGGASCSGGYSRGIGRSKGGY